MCVFLSSQDDNASQLKLLRIIRLFRLAKLLRVLRAGRMFQRWESSMPVNYAMMGLIKFALGTLILSHWLACVFYMIKVRPKPWGTERMRKQPTHARLRES